jgi:hypothetical protein
MLKRDSMFIENVQRSADGVSSSDALCLLFVDYDDDNDKD